MTDFESILNFNILSKSKENKDEFKCQFCKNNLNIKYTFKAHDKNCFIKSLNFNHINILKKLYQTKFEDIEDLDYFLQSNPYIINDYKLRYKFMLYFVEGTEFINNYDIKKEMFNYLIKNFKEELDDVLVYIFPNITKELCNCLNKLENDIKFNYPLIHIKRNLEYITYIYSFIKDKYINHQNQKFKKIIIDTVYDNLDNLYYGDSIISSGFFDNYLELDKLPKQNYYYYLYLIDKRMKQLKHNISLEDIFKYE